MTYREMRRKLEILGCRFQRQADGSHELWVNPANGRRTPSPGTETVTWPLERCTESAETLESPGRTSTKHKPPARPLSEAAGNALQHHQELPTNANLKRESFASF